MESTNNQGVFNAGIWNLFERFFSQGLRFIINIILARLLAPDDYGLIGMILIFLAIGQTFVEGGFINALIQKQDRDEDDFSTTFIFNFFIGLLIYILLYFMAPYVSVFYNEERIVDIMRVVTIVILINSLSVVPRAKFAINMDFKTQAQATTLSAIISSVIAVYLAYLGFGVWALVLQSIISAFINLILFYFFTKWIPNLKFSLSKFNALFSFGYKLLLSNLLDRTFRNLYFIVIGRFFSIAQLGYYTRAEQFAQLPSSNIAGVIQSISFPMLCKIQDNHNKLKSSYISYIKIAAFLNFPILMFLGVQSEEIVLFTLSEKWITVSPYLRLLCIVGLFYPIHFLNLNLLMVKKRSDLYLKLEVIKKVLIALVLICSVPLGIKYVLSGQIFISIISLKINSYYTNKLIDYGFIDQIKDIFLFLLISIISALLMFYFSGFLSFHKGVNLIVNFSFFITIYISVCYFFDVMGIKSLSMLVLKLKNRNHESSK